jgi:hypothetical protein
VALGPVSRTIWPVMAVVGSSPAAITSLASNQKRVVSVWS